jgi:hypothetical protein
MLVIGFVGVENEGIFGLIGGVMEFFAGAFWIVFATVFYLSLEATKQTLPIEHPNADEKKSKFSWKKSLKQ